MSRRKRGRRPSSRRSKLGPAIGALCLLMLSACGGGTAATVSPSASSDGPLVSAVRPLVVVRPRAGGVFSGFSFASGQVYWAMLYGRGDPRGFRFDPADRTTTPLRGLVHGVPAKTDVTVVVFAPGRVALLGQRVVWRGATGVDGFRGVLDQPLFTAAPSGGSFRRIGPRSLALIGNGGMMSRDTLHLSSAAVLWRDYRFRLTTDPLPPQGGEALPSVTGGEDAGLWAATFPDGTAHRVPGCSEFDAGQAVLVGHTAYWPGGRGTSPGPIVSYDLQTRTRGTVPGSETLRLVDDSFARSFATDGDIVVWTARRGTGVTLAGFDRRHDRPIPALRPAAGPSDPAVAGDIVCWLDHRPAQGSAVRGFDLGSGREFTVVLDPTPKDGLAADGGRLYWWHRSSGGRSDAVRLFGARLTRAAGTMRAAPL